MHRPTLEYEDYLNKKLTNQRSYFNALVRYLNNKFNLNVEFKIHRKTPVLVINEDFILHIYNSHVSLAEADNWDYDIVCIETQYTELTALIETVILALISNNTDNFILDWIERATELQNEVDSAEDEYYDEWDAYEDEPPWADDPPEDERDCYEEMINPEEIE